MTDHPPASSSNQWLNYIEAGERLGMSPEAVRTKARRAGWRRMPGNDGRTLVQVPEGADEQPPGRTPAHGALIETLREAVTLLGEQLQAERARADSDRAELVAGRARADADRVEIARFTGELAEKQGIAAAAQAELAEQRTRADKAEQTVRAVQVALAEAEQAAKIALGTVETLRKADDARKASGVLARLRAAWRGE